MFRPVERYADVQSVVASGVGTLDLPVAGTYFAIYLECLDGGVAVSAANIIAGISKIKLSLDGTTMYEANPDAIYDLWEQKYAKIGAVRTAGYLPIILTPDYFDLSREAQYLGWGMGNIKSFQAEITFTASIGGAGQIDQIRTYVERIPLNAPLGEHYRVQEFARSFASAGIQEITELPIEAGNKVSTIAWHLQYNGAAAVVQNLEAIVNNQVVFNSPAGVFQQLMMKSGWQHMVTAAANDFFTIPFALSNDPFGGLPHGELNDLRFRATWSAAPNSYRLYREAMHGLGNSNR